jgi:tripeptide aminopeptidase
MMMQAKQELIERFLRYVQVDTQSDSNSESCPSTPGQWNLARMLADELKAIGLEDVTVDDNGYVMATLPANTDDPVPTVGFIAHMDTATDMTGAGVKPKVIERYEGGDIVLNEAQNIVLSLRDFPELARYAGQTLITTDGTTLLGADDKAGIAEIVTAMDWLIHHPEIKHGKVRVGFTPDEEIGRGAHRFDVEAFGAAFAYTVDGGPLGKLQYETFNAASARITFVGKNVHPGTAKGKMVNALRMVAAFIGKLPAQESPEQTSGYEGFYHPHMLEGNVEKAELRCLIREFDRNRFEERKAALARIADELRAVYGEERILLEIKDQYYNMREKIEPVMAIVDIARQAMENLGIEPAIRPVRGGTDGSQLSFMGLPAPNIFAGGENCHGRYEYVSADTMVKAAQTIVEIIRLVASAPFPSGIHKMQ